MNDEGQKQEGWSWGGDAAAPAAPAEAAEVADESPEAIDGSLIAQAEAKLLGWAVETVFGDRVMIVEKKSTPAGDILVDADGNTYAADADNPSSGKVVAVDYDEDKLGEDVEAQIGQTSESGDDPI